MGRPKRTLSQCQEYARSRGGECLAAKYENEDRKLSWRCSHKHTWEATSASVVGQKSWCKRCADKLSAAKRRKHTIVDCRTFARSKGGRCLSAKYTNNKSKLRWKCSCGNSWYADYGAVLRGTWCPICANGRKRRMYHLGIESMYKLASQNHGKCLSKEYDNVSSVLEWQCSAGHQFHMRVSNALAGHWCQQCGKGLSERLCRAIFTHLYEAPFPRTRPSWLLSKMNARMELDGFNEDLNLAFEYQGVQHYRPVRKFKLDVERLKHIQERDALKASVCAAKGVTLLPIPYEISHCKLESYIREQLEQRGRGRDHWNRLARLDLSQLSVREDDRLQLLRVAGDVKKLDCTATSYLGSRTPHPWKCRVCASEFFAAPKRISSMSLPCLACRKRARRQRVEEEALKKIRLYLAARGELLCSSEYRSQNSPLRILCAKGHKWQTSWASLRHGTACNYCRASEFGSSCRRVSRSATTIEPNDRSHTACEPCYENDGVRSTMRRRQAPHIASGLSC